MLEFETVDQPDLFTDPFDGGTSLPSWVSDRLRSGDDDGRHRLYAVVDAAKAVNLPELLAASGLPHTCLFDGQPAEDFANVCPWLVALDTAATFSRALFANDPQGKNPWCLWDKSCAAFVISTASMEDIRKHFRKFLKLQRSDGSWLYFRFWEGGGRDAELQRGANNRGGIAGFR